MAGFLDLIDRTLETVFRYKEPDASKGRKKLVASIETTEAQFGSAEPARGRKMWSAGNNVVEYKPVLNGVPIVMGSETTAYVASDHFPQFLEGFKAAVQAGDFDDQIKAALGGGGADSGQGAAVTGTRGSRTVDGFKLGSKAQHDNPEWMAAFAKKFGDPDPTIVDPVPNSAGDRWISRAMYDRGVAAANSRKAGAKKK